MVNRHRRERKDEVTEISAEELWVLRGANSPVQVVDVRSPSEFRTGHIPGALNLPLEQIPKRVDVLDQDAVVVLVCLSGHRARLAGGYLTRKHQGLWRLEGGMTAWKAAGYPVSFSQVTHMRPRRRLRLGTGSLAFLGLALAVIDSNPWALVVLSLGCGWMLAGRTDTGEVVRAPRNRRKK